MGSASKTSHNTSSCHIGEVDAVVRFEPKMMVKEEMTGGNRDQGWKKPNYCVPNLEVIFLKRERGKILSFYSF